eukprot:1106506-Amphidinium_carterae.1
MPKQQNSTEVEQANTGVIQSKLTTTCKNWAFNCLCPKRLKLEVAKAVQRVRQQLPILENV